MLNFQSFEVLLVTLYILFYTTKPLFKPFPPHFFRYQVTFFLKGGYKLLKGRKMSTFHPQSDVGEQTKAAWC